MNHNARNVPPTLSALHSVETWLPITQNWIHTQISNLPAVVTNHVVCQSVENPGAFPVENLHDFSRLGPVSSLWFRALGRIGLRKRFERSIIRKNNINLIHSHFGHVAWSNNDLRNPRTGPRHVATFYGFDVNFLPRQPIWKRRYDRLFATIDRILCEGPHMAGCLQALGCPREKISVHHLGIDLDKIQFRQRDWHPALPLRVLIAASFVEKKGIPYAVQALANLQSEIDLQVTIIGDARPNSPGQVEKEKILKILHESNLIGRTRLLGYVSAKTLHEEAYSHDLFLSPSVTAANGDTEGGAPVTIIEMAATGLPVLSTTHCDIPNIILDGVSGRLVPERDAAALSNCIREYTRHPQIWKAYAGAGRKRIDQEFNAVAQAQKLFSIYADVCS